MVLDDKGIQAQIAQKLSGRMCFGVALPGTGHTAYIFDVRTSNGEQWKVSRRYSEFLELDTKLRQVNLPSEGAYLFLNNFFYEPTVPMSRCLVNLLGHFPHYPRSRLLVRRARRWLRKDSGC